MKTSTAITPVHAYPPPNLYFRAMNTANERDFSLLQVRTDHSKVARLEPEPPYSQKNLRPVRRNGSASPDFLHRTRPSSTVLEHEPVYRRPSRPVSSKLLSEDKPEPLPGMVYSLPKRSASLRYEKPSNTNTTEGNSNAPPLPDAAAYDHGLHEVPRPRTFSRASSERSLGNLPPSPAGTTFVCPLRPAEALPATRSSKTSDSPADKQYLFQFPDAKILVFQDQLDISQPSSHSKGRLLGHGPFEIYSMHYGSIIYLHCGSVIYPLLPRLKVLRIGYNKFLVPLSNPERYWQISLFTVDSAIVQNLVLVLEANVKFRNVYFKSEDEETDRLEREGLAKEVAERGNSVRHMSELVDRIIDSKRIGPDMLGEVPRELQSFCRTASNSSFGSSRSGSPVFEELGMLPEDLEEGRDSERLSLEIHTEVFALGPTAQALTERPQHQHLGFASAPEPVCEPPLLATTGSQTIAKAPYPDELFSCEEGGLQEPSKEMPYPLLHLPPPFIRQPLPLSTATDFAVPGLASGFPVLPPFLPIQSPVTVFEPLHRPSSVASGASFDSLLGEFEDSMYNVVVPADSLMYSVSQRPSRRSSVVHPPVSSEPSWMDADCTHEEMMAPRHRTLSRQPSFESTLNSYRLPYHTLITQPVEGSKRPEGSARPGVTETPPHDPALGSRWYPRLPSRQAPHKELESISRGSAFARGTGELDPRGAGFPSASRPAGRFALASGDPGASHRSSNETTNRMHHRPPLVPRSACLQPDGSTTSTSYRAEYHSQSPYRGGASTVLNARAVDQGLLRVRRSIIQSHSADFRSLSKRNLVILSDPPYPVVSNPRVKDQNAPQRLPDNPLSWQGSDVGSTASRRRAAPRFDAEEIFNIVSRGTTPGGLSRTVSSRDVSLGLDRNVPSIHLGDPSLARLKRAPSFTSRLFGW